MGSLSKYANNNVDLSNKVKQNCWQIRKRAFIFYEGGRWFFGKFISLCRANLSTSTGVFFQAIFLFQVMGVHLDECLLFFASNSSNNYISIFTYFFSVGGVKKILKAHIIIKIITLRITFNLQTTIIVTTAVNPHRLLNQVLDKIHTICRLNNICNTWWVLFDCQLEYIVICDMMDVTHYTNHFKKMY